MTTAFSFCQFEVLPSQDPVVAAAEAMAAVDLHGKEADNMEKTAPTDSADYSVGEFLPYTTLLDEDEWLHVCGLIGMLRCQMEMLRESVYNEWAESDELRLDVRELCHRFKRVFGGKAPASMRL